MKRIVVLLILANAVLYFWASARTVGGGQTIAEPEVNRESMRLLGELDAASAATCYRIGPFTDPDDRRAAERFLDSRRIRHQALRDARKVRAVRVFAGPFASRADAAALAGWLNERGIEHVADGARISLGYFAQAALADKFVAHLAAQGVDAVARAEYRQLGPRDWLEAADGDATFADGWPGEATAVVVGCG